jgi:hypothetical protein
MPSYKKEREKKRNLGMHVKHCRNINARNTTRQQSLNGRRQTQRMGNCVAVTENKRQVNQTPSSTEKTNKPENGN